MKNEIVVLTRGGLGSFIMMKYAQTKYPWAQIVPLYIDYKKDNPLILSQVRKSDPPILIDNSLDLSGISEEVFQYNKLRVLSAIGSLYGQFVISGTHDQKAEELAPFLVAPFQGKSLLAQIQWYLNEGFSSKEMTAVNHCQCNSCVRCLWRYCYFVYCGVKVPAFANKTLLLEQIRMINPNKHPEEVKCLRFAEKLLFPINRPVSTQWQFAIDE